MRRPPPRTTLFPYTTLFRSLVEPVSLGDWRSALRRTEGYQLAVLDTPPSVEDHLPAIDGLGERSEEHTSELQSRQYLVCRLLLEKKNKQHARFVRTPSLR